MILVTMIWALSMREYCCSEMLLNHLSALGLMRVQPAQSSLKTVHLLKGVHTRVGDNAYTGRAGSQADEPDPVTRPHQMVGRERAITLTNASLPGRISGPHV